MPPKKSSKVDRTSKKQLVVGNGKNVGKANPLLYVIAIAGLLGAVGAAYFVTAGTDTVHRQAAATAEQTADATKISYPLSLFSDGKVRHFDYQANGLTIRYFILKSADGVVRAAFDACDVCWPAGKGYFQEGDVMVCRNCGRRFASTKVNEVQGGCNPAPLNRTVQGDRLVIRVEDLLQGQPYFDFKGKV